MNLKQIILVSGEMGGWFSSEANKESESTVEATGELNNVVNVNADQPILIMIAIVMMALRLIEVGYFIYRSHRRSLKKKYTTAENNRI